jgi:hypothetical protein
MEMFMVARFRNKFGVVNTNEERILLSGNRGQVVIASRAGKCNWHLQLEMNFRKHAVWGGGGEGYPELV